jgi:NAD(P)-dependent dehydrogenase (short-subunit alcohol dehydrogenase family)
MRLSKDPFDFTGSKVLITGGGSGLGFEIARAFCSRGAKVIISGRSESKLRKSAEHINDHFPNTCNYFPVDVASTASVDQLIKNVSIVFQGSLNILVNSAGTNIRDPIENVSLDDFKAVLDTNLVGTLLVTQKSHEILKAADYGRVINLASIFSTVTYPHRLSYSSSKGAVLLFSKTIALEWAEQGITVNTISPGPLLTEINKKVLDDPDNYNKFCERIPMKRFGNPDEVITSALFLASPMSSYVTGSDIVVDGGWTAS